MKFRHLAIEGPIGAGKTTLARRLAHRTGAREVLEDDRNPFLSDFYAGRPGAALQCQAWFLLTRQRQLRELLQPDLFRQSVVADYMLEKDRIFAYLNLASDDLAAYERMFAALAEGLPRPDAIVLLQASDEVLAGRVRRRARASEQMVGTAYLSDVARAYDHFFFHATGAPVLVVDASAFDFESSDHDLDVLVVEIDRLESGTRHLART